MSVDVVRFIKDDLMNRGVNLNGPCGAFAIANNVAIRLNLGILFKPRPTENNCVVNGVGYAADIVMARSGRIWDMLYDGGGENTPVFNEKEAVNPEWYREPLIGYPLNNEVPKPDVEVEGKESLDWLLRTMHVKMDNMHGELIFRLNTLQSDHEKLALEILQLKARQDRTMVGNFFGAKVTLKSEG